MPWGDKSLNEYVNRLGQNLARSSGSQQSFSFYVVYNPAVNAQAFPGGYVVINSGAISLAESDGELASVLSHEIAHENSCRWKTRQQRRAILSKLLVPSFRSRDVGRARRNRRGGGKRVGINRGARALQSLGGGAR